VALWRQLRRLGCLALNTSAYVLPARSSCHERLQWLAKQVIDAGGEATVSKVLMIEGLDDEKFGNGSTPSEMRNMWNLVAFDMLGNARLRSRLFPGWHREYWAEQVI
jgi:hypothetical protein